MDAKKTIDKQPSPSYDNFTRNTHGNRGLESLAMVDQLIIKQEMEVLEIITGFETANKYTVFDTTGNVMFNIEEDTTCCNRFCCGDCRSLNVMIMDMQGQPVIQLVSPNSCNNFCCLRRIEVQSPPGTTIGFAQQQFTCFYPKIKVKNKNKETFLTVNGPFCAIGKCCGDAEFVLSNNIGEEVLF